MLDPDIAADVNARLELANWYIDNDYALVHEGKPLHWCGCGDTVDLNDPTWAKHGMCVNCQASKEKP